jgi:hypothetical protein
MSDSPFPEAPEDTRYERLPFKLIMRVDEEMEAWVCMVIPADLPEDTPMNDIPSDRCIVLGHIDIKAVRRSAKAKELFISAMKEAFAEAIEQMTGHRPIFGMLS